MLSLAVTLSWAIPNATSGMSTNSPGKDAIVFPYPLSQCRSTIPVTSRDDPIFVQARVDPGLMSQVITAAHQGA
jgi:hypothetical protein